MDDARVGRICRALRRRHRWRQVDLATRAGCHQTTVSRIERGVIGHARLDLARRVFRELGASLDVLVRWRGGDVDRLLDERHARVVEAVHRALSAEGWQPLPEVTYSDFGGRGSIDVLAARADLRVIAVFEIKTDLPSIEATVRRHDEKARLAPKIAKARLGWWPTAVARILVMPDDRTLRRIVERHPATFAAAYPLSTVGVRRWLRAPSGDMAGIWFLTLKPGEIVGQRLTSRTRVRRPG